MYTLPSLLSGLTGCLSLATLATSLPTSDSHSLSKRNATVEQSVFLGVNSTEAEARIANLKANGYYPTSLGIHGSPEDARYAGVWTKQEGSAYETIVGANQSAYEAWVAQWKESGYVSTHVSATGSASNALFAGVMQSMSVGNWVQQCGLDNPYAYVNVTQAAPMVIKGVSMYGAPQERLYCVLGYANTYNHQQVVWYQTDGVHYEYKTLEADETSKRFWRPVFIDSSEDQLLTPIFDDTSVGQWTTVTHVSAAKLEAEIAAKQAEGMYALHISGAGSEGARYAAIFAERLTPLEREWHVTGSVTGFQDNAAVSNMLDDVMKYFMRNESMRQAQVAASVNGTVVASRAYTWAESDRAVVQPDDKFLLGSVSKAFTYAAVDELIHAGILNLTTRVYPLLGYNAPADNRTLDITVQQLLDHTAGYDRTISPDLGFVFVDVARSLNQSGPASLRQVIEWVYERPLDFTPGEREVYCNYGTMLLSYVLTNLTGVSYSSYIEKNVLAGLDVDLYATAADKHVNDAIVQESKYTRVSALKPLSEKKAPGPNGGDESVKEEAIAAFGLRASASTLSQFFGNHNTYGLGGRQKWSYRDGSVDGARAIAWSMDKIDWALTLNNREYSTEGVWNQLVFNDVYNVWVVHANSLAV